MVTGKEVALHERKVKAAAKGKCSWGGELLFDCLYVHVLVCTI